MQISVSAIAFECAYTARLFLQKYEIEDETDNHKMPPSTCFARQGLNPGERPN